MKEKTAQICCWVWFILLQKQVDRKETPQKFEDHWYSALNTRMYCFLHSLKD